MGRLNYEAFGVFPVEILAHILSLCVPSPWFSTNQSIFLQKTKLLRHLKLVLGYEFGLQRIRGLAIVRP